MRSRDRIEPAAGGAAEQSAAALLAAPIQESETMADWAEEDAESDAEGAEIPAERRRRFEALLIEHKIEEAYLVALAFAYDLTKSRHRARELAMRARSLLWERCSWNPANGPTLAIYLCGIVRSQRSHDAEKESTRSEYETAYAEEMAVRHAPTEPSPEEAALETARHADGAEQIALLRRSFEDENDEVNLLWLDFALEGVGEPAEMARRSGREAKDFYRAADRRKRHVRRLLAAKQRAPSP
jgi:hypothetical protein